MQPGAILSRGNRLFVILAMSSNQVAVAELVFGRRKSRVGDVAVVVGPLGPAIALCAGATVETGVWAATDMALSDPELRACQIAAERCKREKALERFAPLNEYAGSAINVRSGGRRVGSKVMA